MTITRILVPTDFGAASTEALAYASDLARATGASLYLLHIVDDIAARFVDFPFAQLGETQTSMEISARQQLDDLVASRASNMPETHTAVLTSTSAASAIVGYAADEHIDVIVMGTHGRTPVARMFLGSVADRVVRTAPCPVLTVRESRPVRRSATEREYMPPTVAV